MMDEQPLRNLRVGVVWLWQAMPATTLRSLADAHGVFRIYFELSH